LRQRLTSLSEVSVVTSHVEIQAFAVIERE
jgi:hypothetical protein